MNKKMQIDFSDLLLSPHAFGETPMTFCTSEHRRICPSITDILLVETGNRVAGEEGGGPPSSPRPSPPRSLTNSGKLELVGECECLNPGKEKGRWLAPPASECPPLERDQYLATTGAGGANQSNL